VSVRILFASVGSHGHTYPLLPLAAAAREAGHDVLFATAEPFHPLLARLGFTPVAAGGDIRSAFREHFAGSGGPPPDRSRMDPQEIMRHAARVFGEIIPRRTVADLVPRITELRPALVVHEAGDIGAGLAARLTGVPGVCHGFGRVSDGSAGPFTGEHTRALAAELGVELPVSAAGTPLPGLGDCYLDIYPASLQGRTFLATAQRVALRPVAFAEPDGEPPPMGGRRLIYLTMGTAFGNPGVMRAAIDGLTGLATVDADVLVAAGPTVDPAGLGPLPPHVRVQRWVPQAAVLPRAALVVHHGGAGTTLGCLAAGVPQLVLPQGADQFQNAAAVVEGRAGVSLGPAELDAAAVADAAGRLLCDPDASAGTATLAAEIAAMPSPLEVAARLPEFVRR
jgi:UDP:flavonoid glycosyltransferase YjiC (YdhE family)